MAVIRHGPNACPRGRNDALRPDSLRAFRRGGGMGGTSGRSGAWAEVVAHDARFEFPDVIGYADGGSRGEHWRGGPWAGEGRVHRVAFLPKPNGASRRLAVLDPAVHARYRV